MAESRGVIVAEDSEKYWYNLTTGQVEKGFVSPSVDRAGPFETAEEAAKAPDLLRERSRAWAEDDARDDAWGSEGAPVSDDEGRDG